MSTLTLTPTTTANSNFVNRLATKAVNNGLYKGDIQSTADKLSKLSRFKKGQLIKLFKDRNLRLVHYKLSDLTPLELNRSASEKWAMEKIEECGGLDMFAFGALSVANVVDPVTGHTVRIVWDGNGRICLAGIWEKMTGIHDETYPCLVYDMSLKEAQYYLSYVQHKGRRQLKKEVTFVSSFYGGDPEAIAMEQALSKCDFYVKGDANMSAPEFPSKHAMEITYNGFWNTWTKICNKNIAPLQLTQQVCNNAWPGAKMSNDMAMACSQLFVTFPYLTKPLAYNRFSDYIENLGGTYKRISDCSSTWKEELKGTTGNVSQSKLLAKKLLKGFLVSSYVNATDIANLRFNLLD